MLLKHTCNDKVHEYMVGFNESNGTKVGLLGVTHRWMDIRATSRLHIETQYKLS
jgi:hypothetical protein